MYVTAYSLQIFSLALFRVQAVALFWNLETQRFSALCMSSMSYHSHGPRQVRGRQYAGKAELNVLFQLAPFCNTERMKPGKETELPGPASLVQQALLPALRLELLPKSSIDVHITVLDSDTSTLGLVAMGVSAASTALAQAGIEMLGMVMGSSAVRISISLTTERGSHFAGARHV